MPLSMTNGLLYIRRQINDVASTAWTDTELAGFVNHEYHMLNKRSPRIFTYVAGSGGDGVAIGANSLYFDLPAGSGTVIFAEILEVGLWVTGGTTPDGPILGKKTVQEIRALQYSDTAAATAPKFWGAERLTGQTPNGRWRVWFYPKVNASLDFNITGRPEVTELAIAPGTAVPELSEVDSYLLWDRAAIRAAISMRHDPAFVQSLISLLPKEEQEQMLVDLRAHRPFRGESTSG